MKVDWGDVFLAVTASVAFGLFLNSWLIFAGTLAAISVLKPQS